MKGNAVKRITQKFRNGGEHNHSGKSSIVRKFVVNSAVIMVLVTLISNLGFGTEVFAAQSYSETVTEARLNQIKADPKIKIISQVTNYDTGYTYSTRVTEEGNAVCNDFDECNKGYTTTYDAFGGYVSICNHCHAWKGPYKKVQVITIPYQYVSGYTITWQYNFPEITNNVEDVSIVENQTAIFSVAAGFPSGTESYQWQKANGNGEEGSIIWEDMEDSENITGTKAASLKIKKATVEQTGEAYRCYLASGVEGLAGTYSASGTLYVAPKSLVSVDCEYKYAEGDIGEVVSASNTSTMADFDNDESLPIRRDQYENIKFVKALASDEEASIEERTIKYGPNTFYVSYTYTGNPAGPQTKYDSFSVNGLDKSGPAFSDLQIIKNDSEDITAKSFILPKDSVDTVTITTTLTDNCDDYTTSSENTEFGYTFTKKGGEPVESEIVEIPANGVLSIPVTKNGLFNIWAKDSNGNKSTKTISVNVFDENFPTAEPIEVKPIGGTPGTSIYKAFEVEIIGSDVEMLSNKPYSMIKFDTQAEAEAYTVADNKEAILANASSKNNYQLTQSGWYVFFVIDKCSQITKLEPVEIKEERLDTINPVVNIVPQNIDGAKLPKYKINVSDNKQVYSWKITGQEETIHPHSAEKEAGSCKFVIDFNPTAAGEYELLVTDLAGNTNKNIISVKERAVSGVEVKGISESMTLNSEIALQDLIRNGQVVLKFNDNTEEVYEYDTEKREQRGQSRYKVVPADDPENLNYVWTVADGKCNYTIHVIDTTDNTKIAEYTMVITGVDNIKPVIGTQSVKWTDGSDYDGSITNDSSKGIIIEVSDYSDNSTPVEELVFEWQVDGAAIANSNSKSITITPNDPTGVYTYTITDNKGNKDGSAGVTIDAWDLEAPTGSVTFDPDASAPSKYKTLKVTATDNKGLAARAFSISTDGNEHWSPINSITVCENATYSIKIKDAVGNITDLGAFDITTIDNSVPIIGGIEIYKNDDTSVKVVVQASDNSGSVQYSIDGSNWQDSNEFVITSSGEYTVYVKDGAGNIETADTAYIDVALITGQESIFGDPEGGSVSDNDPENPGEPSGPKPKAGVIVTKSPASETDQDVKITVNVTNTDLLAEQAFKWGDSGYQSDNTYTMTADGQITFYIKSIYDTGDSYSYRQTVIVNNIDKDSPSITAAQSDVAGPSIKVDVTDGKSLHKLELVRPDGTKELLQLFGKGEKSGSLMVGIVDTGNYHLAIHDRVGHVAEADVNVESITSGNGYNSESLVASIKKSPSTWTNGRVSLIAELADTTSLPNAPFSWNGGTYTNMPLYTVGTNGTVTLQLQDIYKNLIGPASVVIDNIDTGNPTMEDLKQKSGDNNTALINAQDGLSGIKMITIYGGSITEEMQVKLFTTPVSTLSDFEVTLPSNGLYTYKVYDAAGNSCAKQIECTGVTTDQPKIVYTPVEKIVEKEVEKTVEKEVEKTVEVEKEVIKNVPVTIPMPIIQEKTNTVTEYVGRTSSGDFASSINPEIQYVEVPVYVGSQSAAAGGVTATSGGELFQTNEDGEILMRIDPKLKETNPLLYEFKKHSEGIAVGSSIGLVLAMLALVVLAVAFLGLRKRYKADKVFWSQSEMHDVVDGTVSRMIRRLEKEKKDLKKQEYTPKEMELAEAIIDRCIDIQKNMEL